MIKINLLTVERKSAKKKLGGFDPAQKLIAGCVLLLVMAVFFIGWRYMSLDKESKRLDAEIAGAQAETARLKTILAEVQKFEQRTAQLRERVSLIEQLRRDQTGPVHLLDQISRALPPNLWLTDVKQSANLAEVVIDGRCMTLTGLSDFVGNLEQSGYFKRSIEIVSTQTETLPAGELVRFSIRAQFQQPTSAAPDEKGAPVTGKPGG
jgi:type IV pilus assembly protein PilN